MFRVLADMSLPVVQTSIAAARRAERTSNPLGVEDRTRRRAICTLAFDRNETDIPQGWRMRRPAIAILNTGAV
jgi:cobalamin biosynthesis protein CbiG